MKIIVHTFDVLGLRILIGRKSPRSEGYYWRCDAWPRNRKWVGPYVLLADAESHARQTFSSVEPSILPPIDTDHPLRLGDTNG